MDKQEIKQIAVGMVAEAGLINLSRRELCTRAGIPDGSFQYVTGQTFHDFVQELGPDAGTHAVSKTRADPVLRKKQILTAALDMAVVHGYQNITRGLIAERANVSVGLITRYFGTMKNLKRAVMRAAVNSEVLAVVAQGLANGDEQAKKAPQEVKEKAIALISGV
jgi:DNA-binding transcriptional regulator YbjK